MQIRIVNPALQPGARLPLLVGAGHAQASISHRLALQFGAGPRMAASWAEGYYVREITLPLP